MKMITGSIVATVIVGVGVYGIHEKIVKSDGNKKYDIAVALNKQTISEEAPGTNENQKENRVIFSNRYYTVEKIAEVADLPHKGGGNRIAWGHNKAGILYKKNNVFVCIRPEDGNIWQIHQRKPDGKWIAGQTFTHRRPMDMAIDKNDFIYVYAQNDVFRSIKPLDAAKFKEGSGPLAQAKILVHWQSKHGLGMDSNGNILTIRHEDKAGSYYNAGNNKWTHFKRPEHEEYSYPYVIVDGPRGFLLMYRRINDESSCINYFYNNNIPGGAKWATIKTFGNFESWRFMSDLYLDHKGRIHIIYQLGPPGAVYLDSTPADNFSAVHLYGPPTGPFIEEKLPEGYAYGRMTQTRDKKYHYLLIKYQTKAGKKFYSLTYFRGDKEGRIISDSGIHLPVFTPDKGIGWDAVFVNRERFGSDTEDVIHGIYHGNFSVKNTGYVHYFRLDPEKIFINAQTEMPTDTL